MAAPRLRLRRGTQSPSAASINNALIGEPFVDTTAGVLYIADGSASFVTIGGSSFTARVDESLVAATATASGEVKILSRTDASGGGSVTFKVADTANDSTYTWPDAPGGNRILQSDTNGNLSWVTQESGYTGWTISDGSNTTTLANGETLTASGGSGVAVTVTANGDAVSIAGTGTVADVAGLSTTDGGFIVGNGSNFVLESGATARASLGLTIGTDVQAQNAILADLAGLTQAANTFPYFDSATSAATTAISAFGRSLIDDADAATARGTLGVDAAGTDNSTNVTLDDTSHDYLSITGQEITLGPIDLSTDTNGNYVEDVTAGSGLTKTGTASEGQTVGLNVGAGDGISVAADNVAFKNAANLTDNAVLKWSTDQLVNSSISDNGSTVTIQGNLTVNGTTTTVNTTNTTVTDAILELQQGLGGSTAPTSDSGLIVNRGSLDNVFIGYDEGADLFVAGTTAIAGSGSDAAPTPVAFLSLAYNVTDTAGTNEAVISYLAAGDAPDGATAGRYLQNLVVDAGTY